MFEFFIVVIVISILVGLAISIAPLEQRFKTACYILILLVDALAVAYKSGLLN